VGIVSRAKALPGSATERLEALSARRAEAAQAQAEADAAWVAEIIRQVDDQYPKVVVAERAGISRTRLYQILEAEGVDLSRKSGA
jgi:DNA-binding phage protein